MQSQEIFDKIFAKNKELHKIEEIKKATQPAIEIIEISRKNTWVALRGSQVFF